MNVYHLELVHHGFGAEELLIAALWQKHLSAATASFPAEIKKRAAEMERQLLE